MDNLLDNLGPAYHELPRLSRGSVNGGEDVWTYHASASTRPVAVTDCAHERAEIVDKLAGRDGPNGVRLERRELGRDGCHPWSRFFQDAAGPSADARDRRR